MTLLSRILRSFRHGKSIPTDIAIDLNVDSVNEEDVIRFPNTHNDHVASCLCCTKLYIDLGHADWSDVTPGEDPVIECYANVFRFDPNTERASMADIYMHDRARNCPYFSPRP